jgi:hypothetical protein
MALGLRWDVALTRFRQVSFAHTITHRKSSGNSNLVRI